MNTNDTSRTEIESALNNILSDDKFLASPQMSAFLSYVVKQTLAGEATRIKAYTVAVDALGKPESFDPQSDPSVRVLANRLRSSLKTFYTNNPDQPLFIELYRGSYAPHFVDRAGQRRFEQPQNVARPQPAEPISQRYLVNHNLFKRTAQNGRVHDAQQSANDSTSRVNTWLSGEPKKVAGS